MDNAPINSLARLHNSNRFRDFRRGLGDGGSCVEAFLYFDTGKPIRAW